MLCDISLPIAAMLPLSIREQEPKAPSSEAGSRRGFGKMTRRKREIIGLTNEIAAGIA
jgi:hypothetical protein